MRLYFAVVDCLPTQQMPRSAHYRQQQTLSFQPQDDWSGPETGSTNLQVCVQKGRVAECLGGSQRRRFLGGSKPTATAARRWLNWIPKTEFLIDCLYFIYLFIFLPISLILAFSKVDIKIWFIFDFEPVTNATLYSTKLTSLIYTSLNQLTKLTSLLKCKNVVSNGPCMHVIMTEKMLKIVHQF